jgi:prepilin-type N-terminal cleavage/methylation domain-containing protein
MMKHSGFTLIELLIGIMLMTMIMTAVYASYSAGLRSYRKLNTENYLNQNVRQAWRLISRDLRCACISGTNKNVRFVGEHVSESFNSSDNVTFTTYFPFIEPGSGGMEEVSYYVDSDPKTPQEGLVRVRRRLSSSENMKVIENKQEIAPLAKSLKLRYFDGLSWKDIWGIDTGRRITQQSKALPRAVEITIKFSYPEGNDEVSEKELTTMVPVMSNW